MPSAHQLGRLICLLYLLFQSTLGFGRDLLQEDAVLSNPEVPISSASPVETGQSDNGGEAYVSDRIQAVREASNNRFSLASHKTNYVLPVSYSDTRGEGGEPGAAPADWNELEMEFQLSVQVPIWAGVIGRNSFVSLAYTNRSFWQAYTSSGPFRESSHEPELIVTWLSDWQLLGFQCVASQLAVSHQSNGRGDQMSRGWNRIYANFIFEREDYFLSFKPWYRIPDGAWDDNPDIEFYLGNFELVGGYRTGGYAASLLLRNNLRGDNRGAVELRWSFPVGQRIRGYLKYFNGYGENLINYDRHQQSFGVGIELAQGF